MCLCFTCGQVRSQLISDRTLRRQKAWQCTKVSEVKLSLLKLNKPENTSRRNGLLCSYFYTHNTQTHTQTQTSAPVVPVSPVVHRFLRRSSSLTSNCDSGPAIPHLVTEIKATTVEAQPTTYTAIQMRGPGLGAVMTP